MWKKFKKVVKAVVVAVVTAVVTSVPVQAQGTTNAAAFMEELTTTSAGLSGYVWGAGAVGLVVFLAFMGLRMIVKGFKGVAGK